MIITSSVFKKNNKDTINACGQIYGQIDDKELK